MRSGLARTSAGSFAAGLALVTSSAAAFGTMPVLARAAYDSGATPFTLLAARFAVAWAALAAWGRLAGSRSEPPAAEARAIALALGAVGYAGTAMGFFASLRYVPAQVAALLFYTYPALVAAGSAALRRRLPPLPQAVALAVALAGCSLVAGGGAAGVDPRGAALALGAAACYAGYILAGDAVAARLPAGVLARLVVAGAFFSSLVAALASGDRFGAISAPGWLAAVVLGLVSTAYAIAAFLAGLARVGPTAASILSAAEPLVAAGLAARVLGERLTASQAVGAALVVAAVVLVGLSGARKTGPSGENTLGTVPKGGRVSDGAARG